VALPASADYDETLSPPVDVVASPDFEPPEAGTAPDWIRLVSGEWLQGELIHMRRDTVEFDSDKLDELTLDWEDVDAIVCATPQTLVFLSRVFLTGPIAVRGDVVRIRLENGEVRSFDREQITGIVGDESDWRSRWRGKLSVGLSARSGNTDQADVSTSFNLNYETALTRALLTYEGAYGTLNGEENTNNHRGYLRIDRFVFERLYFSPLAFEAFNDEFQNVTIRITAGAGFLYRVIDRSQLIWELGLLGAYRHEELASSGSANDDCAAVPGTQWEWDLTDDLEWDGVYRFQLGIPDPDRSNHHLSTTLSLDLFWDFDLDLTMIWDRNQSPAPDLDGTVPDKDDVRLTVGLGWDF
jgi:putative salt-induced outer membrane protein YdiY